MTHKDAEIRFDRPERRGDRIVVYVSEHKIIQFRSPDEQRSANILESFGEEDDNEIGEVTQQSHEARLATISCNNEARRVSFLANIQLPVWMADLTGINKYVLVYTHRVMNEATTVEGLKNKIWSWLTRDQEFIHSKGSVSADKLDGAFEARGIASMPRLNDLEARQKINYSY